MTRMTDDDTRRAPVPSPPGFSLAVLLTAIFAVVCMLKLAGTITWPWAVILAPIWLPWASAIVFCACAMLLAVRK